MKRFNTEQEILDKIDKYHLEMRWLDGKAESKDHLADSLRGTEEANRIEQLRKDAETIRNERKWREGRLESLKQQLAVFRTPQLAGVDNGDPSIPTTDE